MKKGLLFTILLIYSGFLWSQKQSTDIFRPDIVISNYLTDVNVYAALYTGKMEVPYTVTFTNHPYFETPGFISGTLCYNRVVYKDILMRIDLFKDEITVIPPNMSYRIVLNNEKFNYAILNGTKIIKSVADRKTKEKLLVLLHDGTYPVVKIHNINAIEELSVQEIKRYFSMQYQYAIYSNETLYPVKNKNAILKLFPDRKKELNEYAKLHKLDFGKQTVKSIISLVDHYEYLSKLASR